MVTLGNLKMSSPPSLKFLTVSPICWPFIALINLNSNSPSLIGLPSRTFVPPNSAEISNVIGVGTKPLRNTISVDCIPFLRIETFAERTPSELSVTVIVTAYTDSS